jgi:hypothetical protein
MYTLKIKNSAAWWLFIKDPEKAIIGFDCGTSRHIDACLKEFNGKDISTSGNSIQFETEEDALAFRLKFGI